jgi:hypothetical protein
MIKLFSDAGYIYSNNDIFSCDFYLENEISLRQIPYTFVLRKLNMKDGCAEYHEVEKRELFYSNDKKLILEKTFEDEYYLTIRNKV